MTKLEILNDVATNGYKKITVKLSNGKSRKVLLDGFTANAALKVYQALPETHQQKFIDLPWPRFIDMTWKLISASK